MTNEIELAWAAGFFDGEGSCCVGQHDYLQVTITQVDREVLDRFVAATGAGKVYGPYRFAGYKDHWQSQFQIQAMTRDAEAIMTAIYPYLGSVKRKQYDDARAACKMPARKGFCRADLHDLRADGSQTRDGKCRLCNLAGQNRRYHDRKGTDRAPRASNR